MAKNKNVSDEATPAPATDAAKETVRVRLASVVEFDMPLDTVTGYLDRVMTSAAAGANHDTVPPAIEKRMNGQPIVVTKTTEI